MPDTEQERMIRVTLEIPFFGKSDQAQKFAEKTLPVILKAGIGLFTISDIEVTPGRDVDPDLVLF